MYTHSVKLMLLLGMFSASFPVLAKHKGDFKKIEDYCATDKWVFPVYQDLSNPDDNSKYFIPVTYSKYQKYPLVLNVYDLTQKENALPSMLRTVLINEVFLRKESIEQIYQDDISRIHRGSVSAKFKSSRLFGLLVFDCIAERSSQNPSSNTNYTVIPTSALGDNFVAGIPCVNLLRARSNEKRFAENDLTYAIDFFAGDRSEQDTLIKDFNAFLKVYLASCESGACLSKANFPAVFGLRTSFEKEEL